MKETEQELSILAHIRGKHLLAYFHGTASHYQRCIMKHVKESASNSRLVRFTTGRWPKIRLRQFERSPNKKCPYHVGVRQS
ncbi:hypothetical protein M514_02009 [Trichuris suis]|uniref:Uncharacterized protein n=1 Tax=Trichuris suis TaxID=68888 RepID=A0A085NJJ7_9BILA|nr:hypothetical protein M513_02009 [Trichuris suis]KFD69643.1 hypothetical protein M514_02009 [Trichuris suis]